MEVELYCTQSGKEVVQEFLDSLPHKDLAKVIRDIELLAQYAPDLHEPYTKHIDGPIWELRSKFSSNIYRIFYFIWDGNKLVLLHGFTKKRKKHRRLKLRLQRSDGGLSKPDTINIPNTKRRPHHMDFKEYKAKVFAERPEVKEEYDALAPQYEIIRAEIESRRAIGMTQKQLAEKMGTAQANISRFESGTYNPSLAFLQKMADSLGKTLKISLE